MAKIFKKIFSNEEKDLKKLQNYVIKINSFEQDFEKYSNDELTNKTPEFLSRLENGETLEDILCESFAVVREVSKRTIKLRHFDVQLMGGVCKFYLAHN